MRGVDLGQALGRAGEVEFDDLGRAGADKEKLFDVGTPGQKALHLAIKFFMGIRHAREVTFFKNRGAESGLGKDHHTRRGLQKMRAGARSDDQKERILHFSVQPDDAGQAAENLSLAALLQDGSVTASRRGNGGWIVQDKPSD